MDTIKRGGSDPGKGARGKQVRSLKDLWMAAIRKQSVMVPAKICETKPTAASFVIEMPAIKVYAMLSSGCYVYKPPGSVPRFRAGTCRRKKAPVHRS